MLTGWGKRREGRLAPRARLPEGSATAWALHNLNRTRTQNACVESGFVLLLKAGHNCCRGATVVTQQANHSECGPTAARLPLRTIRTMTTSPMKQDESESDITFDVLKKWNLRAGIVHLVQAVLMLLASQLVPRIRDFRLELTTAFQDYDETQRKLVTNVKDIGSVPIGPLVSVFLFMSAVAHLLVVSPMYFETYCDDIRRGINRARWYEYALSSGLMIVLIAMLFGCRDLASLLLILAVNACMNLFGLLMEVVNQYTTYINWTPFWFGCAAGVWPWVVALMYFLGGGNYDKIPDFVYGVFVSYALFFNTFPINMVLQYKKVGRWADYRYGELWYVFLSLGSKSLLAWVVFGGTQQPN